MDTDYRYKGIPITPAIAEYIITSDLRGKQLRRAEIVDAVQRIHIDNGGLPAEAADLVMTVKKALQNLKKKGQAGNPSCGWWLIEGSTEVDNPSSQEPVDLEGQQQSDQDRQDYSIESIRGTGDEAVYVFYYPAYKKAALATGNDRWLCKIGRTAFLPRIRIFEQGTGMPEQPVIGLVFKTDDSRILESVVHGVLNLRGQWSEESPGTEWFVTSPDDVLAVIKLLVPELNIEKITKV
jgi:hypothetical protein